MESTTINFELGANTKSKFGKPNCLILDEIDGVDVRGSIEALVGIIKAEIPSKTNSKHNQTKNSTPSSGKKSTCYLRRPIICICNHKYAPALKPLLPYAWYVTHLYFYIIYYKHHAKFILGICFFLILNFLLKFATAILVISMSIHHRPPDLSPDSRLF